MTMKGSACLGRDGFKQACIHSDLFSGWQVANEIVKTHTSINSNNSSTDSKETATSTENLPSQIKSNEYSDSKKLLEYSRTRGSASQK